MAAWHGCLYILRAENPEPNIDQVSRGGVETAADAVEATEEVVEAIVEKILIVELQCRQQPEEMAINN